MKKTIIILNIFLLLFVIIIGISAYPINDYGNNLMSLWRFIGLMSLYWFMGLIAINAILFLLWVSNEKWKEGADDIDIYNI